MANTGSHSEDESQSDSKDDSKECAGWIFHYVDKTDLKPGDHIYAYRVGGLYGHHGIYTGKRGREVIHFAGEPNRIKSKSTACI